MCDTANPDAAVEAPAHPAAVEGEDEEEDDEPASEVDSDASDDERIDFVLDGPTGASVGAGGLSDSLKASAGAASTSKAGETEKERLSRLKQEALSANADLVIISVKGKLKKDARFETRLEASVVPGSSMITPQDMLEDMLSWTEEDDNKLLQYINDEQARASSSSLFTSPCTLTLPSKYTSYSGSCLMRKTVLQVQNRALLINALNKALEDLLPLINLRSTDPLSLGSLIRSFNRYVFMSLKQPLLDAAVTASNAPSGTTSVLLDNFKAIASREKKEVSPTNSQCIFIQAFQQLKNRDTSLFRYPGNDGRLFQINFKDEPGIDAGGVFREGMARIMDDLFSEHLELLLLCPNGTHQVHENMDRFLPNPQQTGPLALQMFEFVGRLMGASLRNKMCLAFLFPSIVWKKLVGEKVDAEDLAAVDFYTYTLIKTLRNCEADGITDQASFAAKYEDKLHFSYTGSDGVERELIRGLRDRLVTFETRLEYCDAVLAARLSEFDKQIAAIRIGLQDVVPSKVLQLFSGEQLEVLVAGSPTIDIAQWKAKSSYTIPDSTVRLFWEAMESFTPQEQCMFVRFAWGRARLPAAKDFTTPMRITPAPPGTVLPIAHTCFFSVEMPCYATLEEMRHGLLTVINFGVGGILNS